MTPATVILAGGGDSAPGRPLPPEATVIAADSGLHLAERLGLRVELMVGDLDSARPEAVARALADGSRLERHHPDKDATDLELALEAARRTGGRPVIVVGGVAGDRIDHLLAAAGLLGSDRFADLEIQWWSDRSRVFVVRDQVEIDASVGDLVSIVPVTPQATVTCSGLRWPLSSDILEHGSTRGVSNEVVDPLASVRVASGTVFVVHTERSQP